MKNLFKIALITFVTFGIISCSNDDDNDSIPQTNSIADFVAANKDYTSLKAALDKAGLTATLAGQGDFTVFAPNNDAFAAFLTANGFASLDDVPTGLLTNVLLNHVISGKVVSGNLATGYVNTLAVEVSSGANLSMYVNTSSGVKLNGMSNVTTADIMADNGVIHAVDTVIALPTVVTFATADPTFATLVAALTRPDQPDFVGVLSTPGGTSPAPFTVFAPTNDAFGALLVELGAGDLNDIDGPTLTAALNTHVIAGANVRAENLMDGVVGTLGADLIVDATNATLTDPNERVSKIIVVNVQASNGVVHAIDKVLLPQL
ncbi:secreted/surface protein with fasciclin-like repeats [Aequorivita sublithincola DSM 14238]|uniref:Secreted/surface protein with fasciclin-like repeats n=1 Tax=Aequorivita sublithincola (strain DSM 14238 / LMG 21431 / ACAM 643 / 9-3) TaxID=746697 RepID=I3YT17_AEQSU|nr:fasciclin domain-containing protein [Aequorivita sublithincola]AFL80135.1 secreted/surface protein with fasciclin-like repeats [Aequorivita sublithincola DSM 14238]